MKKGGIAMKKILNLLLKNVGALTFVVLSISANTTSNWIAYQGKLPSRIKEFEK